MSLHTPEQADLTFARALETGDRLRFVLNALVEAQEEAALENPADVYFPAYIHRYAQTISIRVPTPGIATEEMTIHAQFIEPGHFKATAFPFERQITVLSGKMYLEIPKGENGRAAVERIVLSRGETYIQPPNTAIGGGCTIPVITVTVERPGAPMDDTTAHERISGIRGKPKASDAHP